MRHALAFWSLVATVLASLAGCPEDPAPGNTGGSDTTVAADTDGSTSETTPATDVVATDTTGDAISPDTGNDVPDDQPVAPTEGPGFGIDYDSALGTVTPRFELSATDWIAIGWPTNRLRGADGRIDLSSFPNPGNNELLTSYIDIGSSALDGWGLNGSVYIAFDGELAMTSLPNPAASQDDATASVQLRNVSPESPDYGRAWPVTFRWFGDEPFDPFTVTNSLAIRPVFGHPLREAETYCAIITRRVRDTTGGYLAQNVEFAANLDDEPSLAPPVTWLQSGVTMNRGDIATATCFTTQDATGELRRVRDFLDSAPPPVVDLVEEPVVWGEFHGTYTAPNFQSGVKPYAEEGGAMLFDASGAPIVQEQEVNRFMILIPKDKPMPADGWPVVHYAHGTGGDYESCRGRAPSLLAEGLAILCVDQPLHGIRGPDGEFLDGNELILYSFNFLNGESGRMSFRQSAIDSMTLHRMIAAGHFNLSSGDTVAGQEVALDPAHIFFFGHSHGGTSGALVMGVDPLPRAAVLSGAAGVLIETILRRTDPSDLKALAQLALGILGSDLDAFHPALSLIQLLVDTTDPVNYAPYWLAPKQGGAGKHIFMTEGIDDHASPHVGAEALATAGRLPLIRTVAKSSEGHALAKLPVVDLPVSLNVDAGGELRTAGLRQYQAGDHWVALSDPEAKAIWRTFFRTLIDDAQPVTLGLGEKTLTSGAPLSAGESCASATAVDPTLLPVSVVGDTSLATDDHSAGGCGGNDDGAGRRDDVWSFSPDTAGNYRFRVSYEPNVDKDTVRPRPNRIYLVSDCSDMGASCLGSGTDTTLSMTAGDTVFVVVDGAGIDDKGSYKLTVSRSCEVLDCGDRQCGSWGCGSCGSCATGETCNADGICEVAPFGDSCSDAIPVDTLPFEAAGTTLGFDDRYGYQAGDCPGMGSAYGNGSAEVVYAWQVTADGRYNLMLDADYAGNLYVVEDCQDIAGSCLGADRRGGREFIQLDAVAGQNLFVIVDGYQDSSDEGPYTLRIEACQPNCTDRLCGGDGCGGSCGSCDTDSRCIGETSCVPFPYICETSRECVPIETGDRCDDPFLVDALPFSDSGTTATMFDEYGYGSGQCPGQSGARGQGSSDVAYAFTPTKTAIYKITLVGNHDTNLYVVSDCDDIANTCVVAEETEGKNKKETIYPTLSADETVFIMVDGRANSYNDKGSYTFTVSECVPDCEGKVCGSDGCGGSCGGCGPFESCSGGQCATTAGLSCDVPRHVGGLPYKHSANTGSFDDLYANACVADSTTGTGAPNVAYAFSPSKGGSYTAWVTANWDAQVYAVTDCGDVATSCIAGPGTKSIDVEIADGQTVYFIVDGVGSGASGSYTFRVDNTCLPDCDGRNCGSDGCGGSCGTCSLPADTCLDGVCSDLAAVSGNACDSAFVVGDLPFTGQGDTSTAFGHYGVGDNQCAGQSEKGRGSNDQVWQFTPGESGTYTFDVQTTADWDAAVYLVADCDNVGNTCIAGTDEHYPLTHTLVAELAQGETVYLIVDGSDNVFNDAGSYDLHVARHP